MNKLLVLVAALSVAFFYSCGKEIPRGKEPDEQPDDPPEPPKEIPIVDTYWTTESIRGDKYELAFTPSTAAYIFKGRNGYTWIDECPYTYDPPTVTMTAEWKDPPVHLKGSVGDDALAIELFESYDVVRSVELKKQEPKQEEDPVEPTIVGEWKLTHEGSIIDGNIDMKPYTGMAKYTLRYTFKNDCTGWVYYSNEHQESFKWRFSEDQLALTDYVIETDILVDLGPYYMSEEWTVRQLTSDELTVSYWMIPWVEDEQEAYNVIKTFERVNDIYD